jgi:hypothetical protein
MVDAPGKIKIVVISVILKDIANIIDFSTQNESRESYISISKLDLKKRVKKIINVLDNQKN